MLDVRFRAARVAYPEACSGSRRGGCRPRDYTESRTVAVVSNGAGGRGVGVDVAADLVAGTTTARTSVGIRPLVPARDCLARSEASGINATV
jgi:hypothetical protein